MKNTAADSLSTLSDSALLDKLNQAVVYGRRVVLRLLDFLNEVESRRLHFRNAYPSMFAFCRKELRFSEGEASRKLAAARLIKQFPIIRRALELGEVHMTALSLAQSEFTAENVTTLLEQLKGKTSREVERFLMETNPSQVRPAPSPAHQLRKLPAITSTPSRVAAAAAAAAAASAPLLERATVRPFEAAASPLLAPAVSKTTSREPGLPTFSVASEDVASPSVVASSTTPSEQAGVPSAPPHAATPASPVRAPKIPPRSRRSGSDRPSARASLPEATAAPPGHRRIRPTSRTPRSESSSPATAGDARSSARTASGAPSTGSSSSIIACPEPSAVPETRPTSGSPVELIISMKPSAASASSTSVPIFAATNDGSHRRRATMEAASRLLTKPRGRE